MDHKGKGKEKLILPLLYKNYPRYEKHLDQEDTSSQSSYRNLSPYIAKLNPLHICFLDYSPKELNENEDPTLLSSQLLSHLSHFPIQSHKTGITLNSYFWKPILWKYLISSMEMPQSIQQSFINSMRLLLSIANY